MAVGVDVAVALPLTLPVAVAVAVGVNAAVAVGVGRRRSPGGNAEGIDLVVISYIDAATSSDAAVPFAGASHHVGSGVNHSAGVTVVTV